MRDQIALDISPYELAAFQELADAGSISRAAERLGITQPGLSRIVQRVEQQIGVPLLIRTKHGVKLTKTGETFVHESKAVLRELEAFKRKVRRQETEIEGTFLIGAHPQVGAVCFPQIFGKLLHENKGLELKIVHDLSRRIVESVISYRIDFGIVVDPVRHPDLTLVQLYKDPMCFWTAGHPPGGGTAAGEIIIGDLNLKQTESLLSSAQRRGRLRGARIIHAPDLAVVRELTLGGVGVGILTRTVASRGGGAVTLTLIEGLPTWMETVYLVYRKDAQRSRASDYIRSTIVSCLKST